MHVHDLKNGQVKFEESIGRESFAMDKPTHDDPDF
jgi:hypothetical protein